MSTHPKALLYRASHRGTKENDLILEHFAKTSVKNMSEEERLIFADFLECPDEPIYRWVRSKHIEEEVPKKYQTLLEKIQESMQTMNPS